MGVGCVWVLGRLKAMQCVGAFRILVVELCMHIHTHTQSNKPETHTQHTQTDLQCIARDEVHLPQLQRRQAAAAVADVHDGLLMVMCRVTRDIACVCRQHALGHASRVCHKRTAHDLTKLTSLLKPRHPRSRRVCSVAPLCWTISPSVPSVSRSCGVCSA